MRFHTVSVVALYTNQCASLCALCQHNRGYINARKCLLRCWLYSLTYIEWLEAFLDERGFIVMHQPFNRPINGNWGWEQLNIPTFNFNGDITYYIAYSNIISKSWTLKRNSCLTSLSIVWINESPKGSDMNRVSIAARGLKTIVLVVRKYLQYDTFRLS